MTDIVIYRTGRRDETFPAIVVKTYPDDRVDLTVFSTTGIRHATHVPFNSAVEVEGQCWSWPPERRERRRPLDSGTALDAKQPVRETAPVATSEG